MSEIIIGIDLGTTNSEVAVIKDGKIEILEIDGSQLLPSYTGFDNEKKLIVGKEAKNQYALYPERTIRSIKRKMGSDKKVKMGEMEYLPQEISAMILGKLKNTAEAYLDAPVTKAVITVPAQFSDSQRQATRDAGTIAGLEVLRVINEPTAACLGYESAKSETRRKILAFDLGGGTFDVSIVQLEGDVVEVISSHGDNHLGGDDLDDLIATWLKNKIYDSQELSSTLTDISLHRIRQLSETAKMHLSDYPHAKIIEDNITTQAGKAVSVDEELSRQDFELMCQPIINRMMLAVHQALADAKLKPVDLDEIILVGGSTRSPFIQDMLQQELGKQPRQNIHPDLAVAYGAGVMAGRLMGQDSQRILVDITPYTFGTSCLGTVNNEYCPHLFIPIINAGTPLPTSKAKSFYTVYDNQATIDVRTFQGENKDARKNIFIGNFLVDGLSEEPNGNEIILNMRLDLDGILHVTAIEKSTNLTKEIRIEGALAKLTDKKIAESKKKINELFADTGIASLDLEDNDIIELEAKEISDKSFDIHAELSARVEKNLDKMDNIDKEDAKLLLTRLKNAEGVDDDEIITELEDLLFYVETE